MQGRINAFVFSALFTVSFGCAADTKQCESADKFGSTTIFSDCAGAGAISQMSINSTLPPSQALKIALAILEEKGTKVKGESQLAIALLSLMQTENFKVRITDFPGGLLVASANTTAVFVRIDEQTWLQKML